MIKLYQILVFTTHGKKKKSYTKKKNWYKVPAPTWNKNFEWPDGSYSLSYMHDALKEVYVNKKIELYLE